MTSPAPDTTATTKTSPTTTSDPSGTPTTTSDPSGTTSTSADPSGTSATVAAPKRLSVLSYLHRDPILGGEYPTIGVVVATGDQLTVLPLAGYAHQVDPATVRVLTADDLASGTEKG